MRPTGEDAILLDLKTNQYYCLDDVAKRMLEVAAASSSMEQAVTSLLEEYAADSATIHRDLEELVEKLLLHGLVEIDEKNTNG